MDRLFIVIPAYNEQSNIETVIEQWYPLVTQYGSDSRLVIIDDGSTDNTYSLICEAARTRPALVPLTKTNQGHGATVLYGYRYALDADADYIFQTDSDGQTDSAEFDQFWNLRSAYDMSMGMRVSREDGSSRVMVTKTLKTVIKYKFKVSIEDANVPFRLMKTAVLRDCISFIPADYNLPNVALCVACIKLGYSLKFLPITFRPRQGGINSINLKNIFSIGRKALRDFTEINRRLDEEVARRKSMSA